jgi:YebC/PmpR family DNA-binding regulatory protein
MSGHNKWSKIKNKKAVTDAKKSKIFSKIVRLITDEARKSKGDINAPGLRLAVEKAKEVNMPSENIDRAIKKATTDGSAQMETVLYEAYGPGGCALIIEGLTDNRNKAAQEVKHILSKNGFSLAGSGSVTWAFDRKDGEWIPQTTLELSPRETEALEKLIDELEDNDEIQEIYTNAKSTL